MTINPAFLQSMASTGTDGRIYSLFFAVSWMPKLRDTEEVSVTYRKFSLFVSNYKVNRFRS